MSADCQYLPTDHHRAQAIGTIHSNPQTSLMPRWQYASASRLGRALVPLLTPRRDHLFSRASTVAPCCPPRCICPAHAASSQPPTIRRVVAIASRTVRRSTRDFSVSIARHPRAFTIAGMKENRRFENGLTRRLRDGPPRPIEDVLIDPECTATFKNTAEVLLRSLIPDGPLRQMARLALHGIHQDRGERRVRNLCLRWLRGRSPRL